MWPDFSKPPPGYPPFPTSSQPNPNVTMKETEFVFRQREMAVANQSRESRDQPSTMWPNDFIPMGQQTFANCSMNHGGFAPPPDMRQSVPPLNWHNEFKPSGQQYPNISMNSTRQGLAPGPEMSQGVQPLYWHNEFKPSGQQYPKISMNSTRQGLAPGPEMSQGVQPLNWHNDFNSAGQQFPCSSMNRSHEGITFVPEMPQGPQALNWLTDFKPTGQPQTFTNCSMNRGGCTPAIEMSQSVQPVNWCNDFKPTGQENPNISMNRRLEGFVPASEMSQGSQALNWQNDFKQTGQQFANFTMKHAHQGFAPSHEMPQGLLALPWHKDLNPEGLNIGKDSVSVTSTAQGSQLEPRQYFLRSRRAAQPAFNIQEAESSGDESLSNAKASTFVKSRTPPQPCTSKSRAGVLQAFNRKAEPSDGTLVKTKASTFLKRNQISVQPSTSSNRAGAGPAFDQEAESSGGSGDESLSNAKASTFVKSRTPPQPCTSKSRAGVLQAFNQDAESSDDETLPNAKASTLVKNQASPQPSTSKSRAGARPAFDLESESSGDETLLKAKASTFVKRNEISVQPSTSRDCDIGSASVKLGAAKNSGRLSLKNKPGANEDKQYQEIESLLNVEESAMPQKQKRLHSVEDKEGKNKKPRKQPARVNRRTARDTDSDPDDPKEKASSSQPLFLSRSDHAENQHIETIYPSEESGSEDDYEGITSVTREVENLLDSYSDIDAMSRQLVLASFRCMQPELKCIRKKNLPPLDISSNEEALLELLDNLPSNLNQSLRKLIQKAHDHFHSYK
ncbi:Proline--tRNA ligase [Frankliniella fusca]|uniref:Proline--tRNA ligase n=1 Tax=Frankliniella fusca TaxID=407009 RepID=A0AAE1HW62_9NEOP|nr:Proline--tRNA ligase [Frankliniella fusca]